MAVHILSNPNIPDSLCEEYFEHHVRASHYHFHLGMGHMEVWTLARRDASGEIQGA